MDEAVVLGLFEDGHGLVVGDVVAAAGFPQIIGHVSHAYAPVVVIVGAAFVQEFPADAAGTDAHGQMAFVALEPVGDVLNVDGLVFHRDGLLHRDDMHSDAGSAHRDHRGDFFQGKEGHPFEEHSQFRMFLHQRLVHIGIFRTAGNKHGNPVHAVLALIAGSGNRTVLGVFVPVVVFHYAQTGHQVQKVVERLFRRGVVLLAVELVQLLISPVFANAEGISGKHVQHQVQRSLAGDGIHLVFENAGQPPVLRGFGGHFDFAGNAIRDVADQFDKFRVGIFVAKMLRDKFF